MQRGQIFKIHSDFYYVQSEGENFECKLRHVLKKQKQTGYVGDFVEFGGLLGRAPIIAVKNSSADAFIARGGAIPAPIHGNKN